MSALKVTCFAAVAAGLVATTAFAAGDTGKAGGETLLGAARALGNGTIASYARLGPDGAPEVIGVRFDAKALDGLPAHPNPDGRCFDVNGDGAIEVARECLGEYEIRLGLPAPLDGRADLPFRWVMLNWNPHGHPPAPWQVGHFDVHFYIAPEVEIDAIRLGTCAELIDCEDFARATRPVPAQYVHPDHINVDGAVGGMGNHLIDSTTPELNDPATPFTHTWIFGSYDGRIIFQEVMLTRDYLAGRETGCHPIKQPEAWQVGGWYPTRYCIAYDGEADAHIVAMEGFVLRQAGDKLSALEDRDETY